ncbi:MAG: ABC transporter ATP-binding protein [Rhizobiaceae bacterium]
MLEIAGLHVARGGKSVVSDINFTIERGKVLAILGANGAGKSELVLAIAGMMKPGAGEISVNGNSIFGLAPDAIRKAGVAAVPEGHRVLTRLSVDDNLRAAASILPAGDVAAALAETYDLFPELGERKAQLAGTMSGGQQQMLAIGHALMSRPAYLLIDEMSLGLAPLIVKRLMSTIVQLKENGMGIVIVEQFTEVALALADCAIVMRLGKETFNGKAAELKSHPELLHDAYFGQSADA